MTDCVRLDITDAYPNFYQVTTDIPSVKEVDGHPSHRERQALARLMKIHSARTVFEIGTYTGDTAWALSRVKGVEVVWTLDIPKDCQPALPMLPADLAYIGKPKRPLPDNVVKLFGDSATFNFLPYCGHCDLVFVMGAHSEGYIANDLKAAFRLVSPGGVIVLHAGTEEAMETRPRKYRYTFINDRMAVVNTDANQ